MIKAELLAGVQWPSVLGFCLVHFDLSAMLASKWEWWHLICRERRAEDQMMA